MALETLIFIALFAGSSTATRPPRSRSGPRGGRPPSRPPRGGPPNRGKNLPRRSSQGGLVKGGVQTPEDGGKKDSTGGTMGSVAGGGVKTNAQTESKNESTLGSMGSAAGGGAKQAMADAKEKANKLNEEGRNTLNEFKPYSDLAKKLSGREKAASQKDSQAKKAGSAATGKAASLAGAKDAYKAARELRNVQKHGLSKEGIAAARRAATAATWAALDQAAKALAAETLGLSIVAYQAVRHWRITIALIIIFFLLFFLIFTGAGTFNPPQDNTPTTSDTCTPAQFTNQDAFGKTSVCTITVTYNGSAQDITITDTILPGTEFVSADHQGKFDKASNTITWDAQQLNLPLNPVNITVTVTVRITTHQNNTTVYNAYSINPVGLSSGATGGGAACTATGSPNAEAKWQQVLQMGKQYGPLWITFLNDARSVAQKEDYPISVIVGQGALESAHGTSNFAKTRFNFFGFDAYTNNPGAAKPYPSALASIQDYVNLIKNGNGGSNKLYLQAYANRSDPVKMVELIKAGGYATDPAYVSKVTSIPEFKILEGISLPCN